MWDGSLHACRHRKLSLTFNRREIEALPAAAPLVAASMTRYNISVQVSCSIKAEWRRCWQAALLRGGIACAAAALAKRKAHAWHKSIFAKLLPCPAACRQPMGRKLWM